MEENLNNGSIIPQDPIYNTQTGDTTSSDQSIPQEEEIYIIQQTTEYFGTDDVNKVPGSSDIWISSIPNDLKYIWFRTINLYNNNSTQTSTPILITTREDEEEIDVQEWEQTANLDDPETIESTEELSLEEELELMPVEEPEQIVQPPQDYETDQLYTSQAAIFNLLTENGTKEGIFFYEKDAQGNPVVDGDGTPHLYINMSYARSGVLQVGGNNNDLGVFMVLDENDHIVGQWDKNGIALQGGVIQSKNNSSWWNLDTGTLNLNGYITSYTKRYAIGTSQTTHPTGGWNTNPPDLIPEGSYLWQEATLKKTGSPDEVTYVCLGKTGRDGTNGTDGRDIVSINTQYRLSSSDVQLIGGSWSNAAPTYEKNKYYWTRVKVVYNDGNTEYNPDENGVVDLGLTTANKIADDAKEISNLAKSSADSAVADAQIAKQQATAAATSASNAATSASNAQSSASSAATSASNAATSASNAQSSASSAATSASNAQTSASSAATSASNAADSAAEAQTEARNAATSASNAQAKAQNAAISALNAQSSASAAATSASNAQTSANNAALAAETADREAIAAKEAADAAQDSASTAAALAQTADEKATAASAAASQAQQSASQALESAGTANRAANGALSQLSTIEDVMDVLSWIQDHGTYAISTDTTVVPGKYYFTRTGTDPDYSYHFVTNPTGNPSTSSYYECTGVDEAISNYVTSHLALTNDGLYIVMDNLGYKLKLAADGAYIIDPTGQTVATYGENIFFDSNRPQRIGNNNVYIEYYDSDNDTIADALRIVGAAITLSSGKTIEQTVNAVSDELDTVKSTYVTNTTFETRAGAIEASVSKVETTTKEYTDGQIATEVTNRNAAITATASEINSVVSTKVGNDQIISKIRQSSESVKIDANKIDINGVITAGSLAKTTDLPTKVSDLTNDSGFQTASDISNTYAKRVEAIIQTQRIYKSAASGTNSITGTTTWVTSVTDAQNAWTTKRPTYNSNYPVLFTAIQKQTVSQYANNGTTCTCTTPVKDDTLTIIDGGHITTGTIDAARIAANSITANHLATDAIKSNNYHASTNATSPYSATGTFLDLTTGNLYMPNFGVNGDSAYLNGEITANSGRIGLSDSGSYWKIGSTMDYNQQVSASMEAVGTAYIQVGNFQFSDGLLNTQKYTSNNQITYLKQGSTYWDFGVQAPELDTTKAGYIAGIDDNFLYIRNHENTVPSMKQDWNYVFRIDKNGMIWINGVSLDQKYASIDGVHGAYLPLAGGTITGNLTVNGSISGTVTKATQLTHTLTINGTSWDGSSNTTIGTLGVGYGGTGTTSFTSGAALIGNGSGAIQTRAIRNNTSQGALGWTSSSTDTTLITTNTLAYWNGAYQNTTSNIEYVKKGKLGDVVTHNIDEFITETGGIIDGSLQVTDLTAGNLVVTGAGRFTNGLYGDLTGNASTANKVNHDLKIQLNGGTTEGTNQFTFNGSAAKTVNITKSSVGLGNVENTALSTWAGSANLTTTKVGTLAAAAIKGVDTSISAGSTSSNLPTSAAVAAFVEGKGYVTSSGVTSVRVQATSPVVSSVNTAQSSSLNTIISLADGYGDTKNPYASKTKGYVLAAPSGENGAPSFRALGAGDIPALASTVKLAGTDYTAASNVITITQANLQSAVQSTSLVLMTSNERTKLSSIKVSSGGTIDFSGVTASAPLTATVATDKTVNITHNTSGVSKGTYRSVTVDTYGHVTAGTNPTTLSGYGITDAKIASGVITLGSNTITPLTASSTLDATKLSGTASISTTGNAGALTNKALNSTTLNNTSGTFSFSGSGDPWDSTDWVGLQVGSDVDKFQIHALNGTTLEYRQNDSGGTNTSWGNWYSLLSSGNYTDYTVTKTGGGASGTWGINVTGSAGSVAWDNVSSKPITFKAFSGSLSSGGWKTLNGMTSGSILSIAYNNNAAQWNSGTYSSSLVFGCSDTRGLLDLNYSSPIVTFGGGNIGASTDNDPRWYFKMAATTGKTYILPTDSSTLVPTTGTGATGTWGISISGNAATATKATQDGNGANIASTYAKLSGATFTGAVTMNSTLTNKGEVIIQQSTTGSNVYNSANPRLTFKNNGGDQVVQLVMTDYDSVVSPASLTLTGNQGSVNGGEYFIAPNIRATSRFEISAKSYMTYNSTTDSIDFVFK